MGGMRVVCAGEALIDFKSTGDLAFQGYPGGSPFNVAIATARLGAPTGFLAQLSTDRFGQRLVATLEASGVDTSLLHRSDASTTLAFVGEVDGEPWYDFVAHGTADVTFDPRPRPQLPASARWLMFGSIALLQEPAATTIEDTVDGFTHGRVFLDPNVRPALIPDRARYLARLAECVARADLVKVSAQDLAWLAPGGEAELVAEWAGAGPSYVVVTRGPEGAEVHDTRGRIANVAAPEVDVVDTVGAGDAFSGALLASLSAIDGFPADAGRWRGLLARAARVSALTCAREGADPPWASELDAPAGDGSTKP